MPNFVFISISKITLKNKNKISKKLFKDISQIYVNILYIVKHDKFCKIFLLDKIDLLNITIYH